MITATPLGASLTFDVRNFGAIGDAVKNGSGVWTGPTECTDNSAPINNAIAMANFMGGGTVVIPRTGNFLIHSAAVTMLSNVTLRSEGGWLVLSGESTNVHLIAANDCNNIKFVDIKADGNNPNRPAGVGKNTHIIRLHHVIDYEISGCELRRASGYTISHDIDCENGLIKGNRIYDSRGDGIDVHNGAFNNSNLVIEDNTIDGYGFGGVPKAGIHARGEGVKVINNRVKNLMDTTLGNVAGITYGNGELVSGGLIHGNTVELGPNCLNGKGIIINNPFCTVTDNTVFGDVGTYTPYTLQGEQIIFTGNKCRGKQLFDPVTGVLLSTGKTVWHGVNISNDASFCILANNIISDVGGSAFNDQSIGATFNTNHALNADRWGFESDGSSGARFNAQNTSTNCTLGHIETGTDLLTDQVTDVTSTPTLAKLFLSAAAVGGTEAVRKAELDAAISGAFTAGQSGAASSVVTGAGSPGPETIVGTKTIPGGLMGLNGMLTVYYSGRNTAGAASKIYRLRWGGIGGAVFSAFTNTAGNTTVHGCIQIINANSATAQKGQVSNSVNFGASGSTPLTGAVNSAIDQDLVLTCQVTGGTIADTMFVDWYSMQFSPGPT